MPQESAEHSVCMFCKRRLNKVWQIMPIILKKSKYWCVGRLCSIGSHSFEMMWVWMTTLLYTMNYLEGQYYVLQTRNTIPRKKMMAGRNECRVEVLFFLLMLQSHVDAQLLYVYSGWTMSNPRMEKGFVNKDQLHDFILNESYVKMLIT